MILVLIPLSPGDGDRRRQGQTGEHRVLPHRTGDRHGQAGPVQVRHQQDDWGDIRTEGNGVPAELPSTSLFEPHVGDEFS